MASIPADLDDPRVVDPLVTHATRARAETARGCGHALDIAALRVPDIRVWALWADGEPSRSARSGRYRPGMAR